MIGIKVKKIKNDGIKIWGNPNLELKKSYTIKNYLKIIVYLWFQQ